MARYPGDVSLSLRRCNGNRLSIIRRRGWISILIVAVMGNGCHRRETAEEVDARAARITEVAKGDSAIINMPSAGSHKSRVIEFSTSITGRRSARPQEIGRNGTYLERELDDSIPLSKGAVLFELSSFFFFSFFLSPSPFFLHSRSSLCGAR